MLYLIGLGLNEKGYSKEAYEAISNSDKIYIENYTSNYPYPISALEKQFKDKKFIPANREFVENFRFIEEAKNKNIVLLVYGSPLMATTHITILNEAKKKDIEIKIIHSSSVFDAVAETGLQLYKFGKIASMPGFEADSYIDIVKENQKIQAHTLILIDIGMELKSALEKLVIDSNKKNIKLDKIIVCSQLGTLNSNIYFNSINELKKKNVRKPFCIIIPGKLHFMERESLENLKG